MEEHKRQVEHIASQVHSFHQRRETFRIYHGTTSTTRRTKLSSKNIIDTSGLDHVLEIDRERHVAVVEPNVSMFKLVEATLKADLLPPVVMEYPAITVGGIYSPACITRSWQ